MAKPPVSNALRRTTGRDGDLTQRQSLATSFPILGGNSTTVGKDPRTFIVTVTTAGEIPTIPELQTAIQSAYSSTVTPRVGDSIGVEHEGREKMVFTILGSGTGNTLFSFAITIEGVSYRVKGVQRRSW